MLSSNFLAVKVGYLRGRLNAGVMHLYCHVEENRICEEPSSGSTSVPELSLH